MALLAGAPESATATSAAQQTVPIEIGVVRGLGTMTPYVSEAMGFFEAGGLSKIKIVKFGDGTSLMEAFAAGNINVALVGNVPAAVWKTRGAPVRAIAGANGGEQIIVVRKDSEIDRLEDLKGKRLAAPRKGTITESLLRGYILEQVAGLDPNTDLELIYGMVPADMPAALVRGEVDAILTWEPFAAKCELEFGDRTRVLMDVPKVWKASHGGTNYPCRLLIVREDLLQEHPETVRKVFEVHKRSVEFINSEHDRANAILAKAMSLDQKIIDRARGRADFDWRLDIPGNKEMIDLPRRLGYIESLPEWDSFFYSGFVAP